MSSHFLFHPDASEVIPFNARYTFPSQSTKTQKSTVKITPKTSGSYTATSNRVIRLELPSDGYLNALESYLSFKVAWTTTDATDKPRFQNGVHSAFSRLRVLYGSLVIEDIQDYGSLVRLLSEATISDDYRHGPGCVLEGLTSEIFVSQTTSNGDGNAIFATSDALTIDSETLPANAAAATKSTMFMRNSTTQLVDLSRVARRYCIRPLSGLLNSKKLIPLKWMASQLSIELTLASENYCALWSANTPTYTISDVSYVAELLEFDSTYDQAFYMGMQQGGIPIQISTWHYHTANVAGLPFTFQIHERSRSLKTAFACVRDTSGGSNSVDTGMMFYDLAMSTAGASGASAAARQEIGEYQWRIGGRYYPSQPVDCADGGAEAYMELQKALNQVGDYATGSRIKYLDWTTSHPGYYVSAGVPITYGTVAPTTSIPVGRGTKFIMSCEFETSNGMEMSGVNAQEQNDLMLQIKPVSGSGGSISNKRVDVFVFFDAMLIIRPGNVVDLIQ